MSNYITSMSNVNIELLKKVDVTQPAGKTYKQMVVTHNDLTDGKIDGKKIMDFATPPAVWDMLLAASVGDKFKISREKDKKEGKYWQWIGATPISEEEAAVEPTSCQAPNGRYGADHLMPPVVTKPYAKTERVGSWETPEERAARQVMIVRQSSLSTAVALLEKNVGPEKVIEVAKEFEAYVLGLDNPKSDEPE